MDGLINAILEDQLVKHQTQMARLRRIAQWYIKRQSVSLGTRWAIYVIACDAKVLPKHTWIQRLPIFDELDVSWYDDFYVDRYALVEWANIVDDIRDDEEEARFFPHLARIKEEIMQAGYAGFTLDW